MYTYLQRIYRWDWDDLDIGGVDCDDDAGEEESDDEEE